MYLFYLFCILGALVICVYFYICTFFVTIWPLLLGVVLAAAFWVTVWAYSEQDILPLLPVTVEKPLFFVEDIKVNRPRRKRSKKVCSLT